MLTFGELEADEEAEEVAKGFAVFLLRVLFLAAAAATAAKDGLGAASNDLNDPVGSFGNVSRSGEIETETAS
jgi:hypothetical protein